MAEGKRAKLTPTQAKVVKAKIKAELTDTPQGKVAMEVYPHMTPGSAAVQMSRELKKPNVQEALDNAMASFGLTAETLAATVGGALGAHKTLQVEGDLVETEVPDHGIRLKAAGMAAMWLGVGKQSDGNTTNVNFINVAQEQKAKYDI